MARGKCITAGWGVDSARRSSGWEKAILRDVARVASGTRIVRIDSNVIEATCDLRGLTVMPGWIDSHNQFAAHFDRDTGKVRSGQVNETPQQAMLYEEPVTLGGPTDSGGGAASAERSRNWVSHPATRPLEPPW